MRGLPQLLQLKMNFFSSFSVKTFVLILNEDAAQHVPV